MYRAIYRACISALLAGVVGDTVGGVLSDLLLRRTANLVLARRGVLYGDGVAGHDETHAQTGENHGAQYLWLMG